MLKKTLCFWKNFRVFSLSKYSKNKTVEQDFVEKKICDCINLRTGQEINWLMRQSSKTCSQTKERVIACLTILPQQRFYRHALLFEIVL